MEQTLNATQLSFGGPVLSFAAGNLGSFQYVGGTGTTNTYNVIQTPLAPDNGTTLITEGSGDLVRVFANQSRLYVDGRAPNRVEVGANGRLTNITRDVILSNSTDATDLVSDDSADPNNPTATITSNTLSYGNPNAVIRYSNLSSLTLKGGPGGGTFDVLNTPAGVITTLMGPQSGNNGFLTNVQGTTGTLVVSTPLLSAVNVGVTVNSLDQIRAPVGVDVNSPFGIGVEVIDSASTAHVYNLTTASLSRDGARVVNFASTFRSGVELVGSNTGGSTFNILGVPPQSASSAFSLRTQTSDSVNIGSTSNTISGFGAIGISGGGALTLNDQGETNPRTYTFSGSGISLISSTGTTVNYSGAPRVILNGGSGGNTFMVQLAAAATPITFNAGAGGDTLVGPDRPTLWQLVDGVSDDMLVNGHPQVVFSGISNLRGGSANNTFQFSDGYQLSGSIDGGGGTNTLDYSAYAGSNVVVDLALDAPSATGVGGSVAHIQNVIGASGGGDQGFYNLLIGNGGNTLTGGFGRRNILVAGASATTLNAGDGEDLLIGGFTMYDTDPALTAWLQLAAYWSGADGNIDDYFARAANLTTGNGVPLLDATTATGNGGGNTMNGNGALALIYTDGQDNISGFDANSQLVGIAP